MYIFHGSPGWFKNKVNKLACNRNIYWFFFPLLLWHCYEMQNMHPVLWPSTQPMQSQVSSRIKSIKMWHCIKRQFPHHYRRKYSKFILNLQLKCLWIIFLNTFKVTFSYLFHLNFIFDPEGKYHGRKKWKLLLCNERKTFTWRKISQ